MSAHATRAVTAGPADTGAAAPSDEVLDFHRRQSRFSSPGRHAMLFDTLPSDPAGIARTIQGLVIYEHVAEPFYGCRLPRQRLGESHIRPLEAMLDALLALDGRPLAEPRAPERRLVGICRHYMLLAVSMLRHHGVPARGRGGFGAYFSPTTFEDHWVCEYWDAAAGCWKLLDAQLDEVFRRNLAIGFDPCDVPRDRFLTSPVAWQGCRDGTFEAQRFGIEFSRLRGSWFVAGSLVRDLATICGAEILPWDVWGVQPPQPIDLVPERIAFFDAVAAMTADPDRNHRPMLDRFARDERLSLPATVFNALTMRNEPVQA